MDGRPARLVVVITGLRTGGAELTLLKVLERLDPAWAPRVISLTDVGEVGRRIEALGIPVEALGLTPGRVGPLAVARLATRLRALRPDVVHTWMYHADLVGGLAAKLAGGCGIGWAIHNTSLDPDRTKLSTRLVARACARLSRLVPDRILSVSEAARAAHIAIGYAAGRLVVVPNGFDLSRFRPDGEARAEVRRELGLAAEAPVVGLVARWDPLKNIEGFVTVAGLVHGRRADARFVLVGAGLDRDNARLAECTQDAGVSGATRLLGPRDDVPRLMAALDVLVSPSWGEAFPSVLGEAMACGVPCAVTAAGDSAMIVGDSGRVVACGDMAGLAAATDDLLALSPTQRAELGARARGRVASQFEIGAIVKKYELFYAGLAALGAQRKAAG